MSINVLGTLTRRRRREKRSKRRRIKRILHILTSAEICKSKKIST
jgi:hypothetical protein